MFKMLFLTISVGRNNDPEYWKQIRNESTAKRKLIHIPYLMQLLSTFYCLHFVKKFCAREILCVNLH